MKNILIAGSTGSIGTQALEVIKELSDVKITSLIAGTNKKLLELQMKENNVEKGFLKNDDFDLKELVSEANYVINAISGFAGLELSIETLKQGKILCLANKESIVVAGHILVDLIDKFNGVIIPIDSEHSAIWQIIDSGKYLKKVWLTASGGAFRDVAFEDLKNVNVSDALKHPNWSMGKKITIDSATMFNKALEIIEAKWLFNLNKDEIIPVIHRESIIHSMVQFIDNVIIAKLSKPSMKTPIQYALTYPHRVKAIDDELSITDLSKLTFSEIDYKKYPSIKIVFDYYDKEESYMTVLNAANEVAVNLFLEEKIKFYDIFIIVKEMMEQHVGIKEPLVKKIYEIDKETREKVLKKWRK